MINKSSIIIIIIIRLQDSTVATEIHKAEQSKLHASQCWKTLVSVISSNSNDKRNENSTNRLDMLLNLDALHDYPTSVIQFVKHNLIGAYLNELAQDTSTASNLLSDSIDQIQQCLRRMHRVQSKLIKRRTNRYNESKSNSIDANDDGFLIRAKRDSSWMHLWYYALMRIKAIINFHSYRLQLNELDLLNKEVNQSNVFVFMFSKFNFFLGICRIMKFVKLIYVLTIKA